MGRALERRRFEFLPTLCTDDWLTSKEIGRALLLGDGDGRFLNGLLTEIPTVVVDLVDSSLEMIAVARARVVRTHSAEQAASRARFIQADAREWSPAAGTNYDLIASHFFLDCLMEKEIDGLLTRLKPCFSSRTVWIVSEFRQPSHGVAAWRARLWIGGLYRAFGWFTGLKIRRLPDYHRVFLTHGFTLQREVVAEWGLLVSEWWECRG